MQLFADEPSITRKAIHAIFSPDIKRLLPIQKVMNLPSDIFHLAAKEKSATRLLLVWRICQHQRINKFSGSFAIPVRTLLFAAANLPKLEEVAGLRHADTEIRQPFINALDTCHTTFHWEMTSYSAFLEKADAFDFSSCDNQDETDWWRFYEDSVLIKPLV